MTTSLTPTTYTHTFAFPFNIESNTPDASGIAPRALLGALIAKAAMLPLDEIVDAVGPPIDCFHTDAKGTLRSKDSIPVYSHLEMEAALCVWECLNDWTTGAHADVKSHLVELRNALGSVELRHRSIELGRYCLKVHDAIPENVRDGHAYDWVIIPEILSTIDFTNGTEPTLPVEQAALQVVSALWDADNNTRRLEPAQPPPPLADEAEDDEEPEDTVQSEFDVCCPACGEDHLLDILITTFARLSTDGTEPEGDHEWDDNSMIRCECGWKGLVRHTRQKAIAESKLLRPANTLTPNQ